MKRAKPPAARPKSDPTAFVFYHVTGGRFSILALDNPPSLYFVTSVSRKNFRTESHCVVGDFKRRLKGYREDPFTVELGTLPQIWPYVSGQITRKLGRLEISVLMDMLEKNVKKIHDKGPFKVKEFHHSFRHLDHEFKVSTPLDMKKFLKDCPEFRTFKGRQTRLNIHWVGRRGLKPRMVRLPVKVI
jgi:hypothetical protein